MLYLIDERRSAFLNDTVIATPFDLYIYSFSAFNQPYSISHVPFLAAAASHSPGFTAFRDRPGFIYYYTIDFGLRPEYLAFVDGILSLNHLIIGHLINQCWAGYLKA